MPGKIGDQYASEIAEAGAMTVEEAEERYLKRVGKPFADVYDVALRSLSGGGSNGEIDLSRVCMVGDALETDICGGTAMGIDTVWILETGIHASNSSDRDTSTCAQSILDSFNQQSSSSPTSYASGRQLSPTVLMPSFRW